jgi:hypothetical protein
MQGAVQLRYDAAGVFEGDTKEEFAAHFRTTRLETVPEYCTKAT